MDLLSSCSRNTEFLSSCCWKLEVSSRVAAGDSELLSICSRKSVFLRSSSVGCKIPLESWWETRGSSRVWLVLRVPGTCVRASSQVLLGNLSLARICRGLLSCCSNGWLLPSFSKGLLSPCGPGLLCSCGGFNSLQWWCASSSLLVV